MSPEEQRRIKWEMKRQVNDGLALLILAAYALNHNDLPWGINTPIKTELLVLMAKGEMLYGGNS